MTISERVHAAKLQFASGTLKTDSSGYLHVKGVGDIKLSDEFVASVGRTPRASGTITARWNQAVETEMTHNRCSKVKATAMVVRKYPELRAQLIAEANPGRPQTARPVAKQTPLAQFNVELQRLMESGLTKLEAAKQLSQRMGLSQSPGVKPFVSSRNDY